MSPTEALDIVRRAFPGLRISEVARFDFMMGNSIKIKKGKATLIVGFNGRTAMCAAEVSVDGVEYALTPYAHDGFDHSTFAVRVERLAKAIDALAALRGGK